MLDLATIDLEMLAEALSDQGWNGRWLFDPRSGQTGYWASDLDGLDDESQEVLVHVEPLPSWVWYQDMVDFAERVSDEQAGQRLGRALQGKGAFRRFGDELHRKYPELIRPWNAFRRNRADVRAVEWLQDNDMIAELTQQQFVADHPDPSVP